MPVRRYGLISDTHGALHPGVFAIFEGVEAILHAGDVCGEGILDELEAIAPTHAVCGNCDFPSPRLPPLRRVDLPFGTAIVSHSHLLGAASGDAEATAAHFAGQAPRLILFGHTHKALRRRVGDCWVVNPGPAGKPRFRDEPQVVVLHWDDAEDAMHFVDHRLDWAAVGKAR